MNYDEILKCYEGHTELHANTSFEFGLMNETYYTLFRDHDLLEYCLLYTSPSPRDLSTSRMPSTA